MKFPAGLLVLAVLYFVVGAPSTFAAPSGLAVCQNIPSQLIREYFQYGDAVLMAETVPIGAPQKKGTGEQGRGFSGSITTTYAVRPLKFFKNTGQLPDSGFTVVDVEDYGADGGFQGGGLLPYSKSIALIAVTKSNGSPPGREIFASLLCSAAEHSTKVK